MQPLQFFWLLIGITFAAALARRIVIARRAARYQALAREWNMVYVADDRFHLRDRIRGHLPLVGAADVRVTDLMYTTDNDRRRYLFTCEFGRGVVFAQKRRRRVMAFDEPLSPTPHAPIALSLATESGPLIDQYRELGKNR